MLEQKLVKKSIPILDIDNFVSYHNLFDLYIKPAVKAIRVNITSAIRDG